MKNLDLALQEQKDFLEQWPLERVKNMSLEEYVHPDDENTFIYWLKKKTENVGNIWIRGPFKAGIYHKKHSDEIRLSKRMKTDENYTWLSKYGDTREEAFQNVKPIILRIINSSLSNNLEEIDDVDFKDVVK